ncbi:hypothetical protein ABIB40_002006 [Pedobacter sp. UYP30]
MTFLAKLKWPARWNRPSSSLEEKTPEAACRSRTSFSYEEDSQPCEGISLGKGLEASV